MQKYDFSLSSKFRRQEKRQSGSLLVEEHDIESWRRQAVSLGKKQLSFVCQPGGGRERGRGSEEVRDGVREEV